LHPHSPRKEPECASGRTCCLADRPKEMLRSQGHVLHRCIIANDASGREGGL
jgi:hypothetical protein